MDQIRAISLFVLLFSLVLPGLSHRLSRRPWLLVAAKYVIFGVYALANLYETILFRGVMPQPIAMLQPLWSYRESLALTGGVAGTFKGLLTGTGGVVVTNPRLLEEIILNILLYIPLGYLLPFTWPSLAGRKRPVPLLMWRVVLIGFVCSAVTEVSQLVFRIGLFEFDDMMNNTLGCALGCLIYAFLRRAGLSAPD